jgi:MraZ protein
MNIRCQKVHRNVKKWVEKTQRGGKMFIGEYSHSIDAKGRVTIPSKFREELGDNCVVTPGFDDCLEIHTYERWKQKVEVLLNPTKVDEKLRRLRRQIFPKSLACDYDKQGRILISQELRERAFLADKVMLVGLGDHIELWDYDKWISYNEMDNEEFNSIGEDVFSQL